MAARDPDPRPLIAHVLHRFDVGGLENGVVNLINRMPADRYRHAVIALTEVGSLRQRVQRDDVVFHALHKAPGHGLREARPFACVLRELGVDVVHTRNLGTLEMQAVAWWAGVPVRVHGEHGWDTHDPEGKSVKYRWVRRAWRPFVHRYIALSGQLRQYLCRDVGIPEDKVTQICNGVDTQRFSPAVGGRAMVAGLPWADARAWVVGTVGRLQDIKDQVTLARAFVRALELAPEARATMRLAVVGEGPLRQPVQAVLHAAGVEDLAWLPGERSDVPAVLRGLDAFVLPSQAEGISNTILEAMATGLPIVATRVGGNAELLVDGQSGRLVAPCDVEGLAAALLDDWRNQEGARARGRAALERVRRHFSLDAMIAAYCAFYDGELARTQARRSARLA